ncbi:K(+)-transporting ATPase subunit F [Novispirillum itersonii]|nr:K(+)-transporting ATPase subunit F [Novispirillum itersonii]
MTFSDDPLGLALTAATALGLAAYLLYALFHPDQF